MGSLKELLIKVGLDDKQYRKGMSRMQKSLSTFARSFGALGIGVGIAAGLRDAVIKIKKFEQANANLASILGKSRKEMGRLIKSAKMLGATTAFSATQVVELQTELAKLGFVESVIIRTTKAIEDFSIAIGTDAASAAALAGGALRGFGLEASDMEDLVSTLAVATTKSGLTFEKLETSLRLIAPVAKNAGVSFQRTTALLGALVNRNVDASSAGTGLRNVFLRLSKSGMTWEEAMKRIRNATDKNKEAAALFGVKVATVAVILSETAEEVDTLTESITGVNEELRIMVDKRLDTMEGRLTLLSSAWEGLVLSIDDGSGKLSTAFKGAIEGATTLLSRITDLNEGTISWKKQIGELIKEGYGLNLWIASFQALTGGTAGAAAGAIRVMLGDPNDISNIQRRIEGLKDSIRELTQDELKSEGSAVLLDKLRDQFFALSGDVNQAERAVLDFYNTLLKPIAIPGTPKPKGGGGGGGGSAPTMPTDVVSEIDMGSSIEGLVEIVEIFDRMIPVIDDARLKEEQFNVALGMTSVMMRTLKQDTEIAQQATEDFTEAQVENAERVQEITRSLNAAFQEMAADGVVALGEALAEMMTGAEGVEGALAKFGKTIFLILADMGSQIGKFMIVLGIQMEAYSQMNKNPVSGGFALVAAGLALVIASAVLKSIMKPKKLAKGGLVFGPTLATVGDNPGARHDPEVVAPLSRLKNMLGGGGSAFSLTATIRGSDLEFMLERQAVISNRAG